MPGIVDLPSGWRLPDGEIVLTQQIHKRLARSGISFQALPQVGFSFRYSGHGKDGHEAYGRRNHDRSFDIHLSVLNESQSLPALSIGLRDFIGTGWYSSEYMVASKSFGGLQLTAGLGYGRLAGRNTISNPLRLINSSFDDRGTNKVSTGGTLGNINWFRGPASPFYAISFEIGHKLRLSAEYSPDLMASENEYITVESPWNYGIDYRVNDYVSVKIQNLHGNETSFTANLSVNPQRPPFVGGKDLAPVPMRIRGDKNHSSQNGNEYLIKKVLEADKFILHNLKIKANTVTLQVTNTKFRSTAQAVGRLSSTLQRFTSDKVKFANISFIGEDLVLASYHIDLEKITGEQFSVKSNEHVEPPIKSVDLANLNSIDLKQRFSWGIGPYVTHRLFNPDLPLSAETGLELNGAYHIQPGLKLSGSFRKSVLTNLTDNDRSQTLSYLAFIQTGRFMTMLDKMGTYMNCPCHI